LFIDNFLPIIINITTFDIGDHTMNIRQFIVISATIAAISTFTPVYSEDNANKDAATGSRTLSAGIGLPDFSPPTQARIGLAIGPFPEYEGSDNYSATALPLVDIRKSGAFFLKGASINVNDGLASAGLSLLHIITADTSGHRMHLTAGPLVRAYRGREESDNTVFDGLGDIDQSVSIGGFLQVSSGPWLGMATVTPQDVGSDKDGLLVTLDIDYITSVSNGFTISTGMTTSWADDDYMQGYFGVTNTQAARSGLRQFDSKAGFKDVGLQLKTSYALSPRWAIEGQLGYWRLLNDASDSPIVKNEGSADQIRGLVGISYQF
jgi:outer membrane scaffolding protein for murein synthesis (MipA/OmpV family)